MFSTSFAGGSTSKIIVLKAWVPSTGLEKADLAYNTSGLTAKYTRVGSTPTTITLATATQGTYTSGGFVVVNAAAGTYELGVPNAALNAGVDYVTIDLYGVTDCVISSYHIDITGSDPRAAALVAGSGGVATQASVDAVDDFLDTEVAAIKAKTDNLPSDPADASVVAGLIATLEAKVDAVDDYIDTELAAIKAKTDQLTFTVANVLDANVQRVNDVAITGDGSATPFDV